MSRWSRTPVRHVWRADAHPRAGRRASARGRLLPAGAVRRPVHQARRHRPDRFANPARRLPLLHRRRLGRLLAPPSRTSSSPRGAALERVVGRTSSSFSTASRGVVDKGGDVLSPAWQVFTDRSSGSVASFASDHPAHADAAVAVDARGQANDVPVRRVVAGLDTAPTAAYAESRRLFDVLLGRSRRPWPRRRGVRPRPGRTMRSPATRSSRRDRAFARRSCDQRPGGHDPGGRAARAAERPPGTALFVMEMRGTFSYRKAGVPGLRAHYEPSSTTSRPTRGSTPTGSGCSA